MHASFAVALNDRSRPIGRRRRGGPPGAAFDRLDGKVVARHARALPIRRRTRPGRLPDMQTGRQANRQTVSLPPEQAGHPANRQACSNADRRAVMLPAMRMAIRRMGQGLPDKHSAANRVRQPGPLSGQAEPDRPLTLTTSRNRPALGASSNAVSYTHLTLPTSDLV